MRPLEEWLCDRCGNILTDKDGALEWLESQDGLRAFGIVHNREKCLARHQDRREAPLSGFLGPRGLGALLALMDAGRLLDPDGEYPKVVRDLRPYADMVRRLQLPYFEEARLYFGQLVSDDGYESYPNHELGRFSLELCRSIIARYEHRP